MTSRIQYASLADATSFMKLWHGRASTLRHLGDAASSDYFFTDQKGFDRVLRLVDSTYRSAVEVDAELEFVSYLNGNRVKVSNPIPSTDGQAVVITNPFLVSAFEYVPGIEVSPNSLEWNQEFFQAWGAAMARMHVASQHFQPYRGAVKLWTWDEEIIYRTASENLPEDDKVVLAVMNDLFARVKLLETDKKYFGVIHSDFSPQNFRFNRDTKEVTIFDFGSACYNWYAADLANAFSGFRHHPDKAKIQEGILKGYQAIRPLSKFEANSFNLLKHIRALYIYLDRLYWFGKNPDEAQKVKLKEARDYLLSRTS